MGPFSSLLLRKDIVSYEGYDSEFKAAVGEEKIDYSNFSQHKIIGNDNPFLIGKREQWKRVVDRI
jgi:hypothetical protein